MDFDLERYAPFYWTAIANRWTAASSRLYQSRFDVGVVEWRVLATLAVRLVATALDAARLASLDVAAASRAMQSLHRRELVEPAPGRHPGRSRPFLMTVMGRTTFAEMRALAEAQEERLLAPLSVDERAELLRMLRLIYQRLPELSQGSDRAKVDVDESHRSGDIG